MNIYIGNLSYDATEQDLQKAFEAFGHVESAKIVTDMYTGRSRGFAFVEMASRTEGQSAIEGLNGTNLRGRTIKVSEARPRSKGRRGSGRPDRERRRY